MLWGSDWDPLLANDTTACSRKRMGEVVDGEYQKYAVEAGAYIREHFFGTDPRLLDMVKHLSDDQLKKLRLGGHDPVKVYTAYQARDRDTRGSRPSSSPGRSRATAWARRARARTSPTSRRS